MSLSNASETIFFALSAPGMGEWGVILVLVLVLFGGKNIPDLAKALGKGIREFKRAVNGIGDDLNEEGSGAARRDASLPPPSAPPQQAEPADRDRSRPA